MSDSIEIIQPCSSILTPYEEVIDFPRRLEMAGRTCYKSENKTTQTSAEAFIRKLIKSGHHSVLEHCSITVLIIGDRSMSHQLVRHRLAAYSQESMRYCDYSKDEFGSKLQVVCPPKIRENKVAFERWERDMEDAYRGYDVLRMLKIPAEDARSVLPQATKTEVVTTFNIRQWRHVFEERALNKRAQWQIRQIMMGILLRFSHGIPVLFKDIRDSVEHSPAYFPCMWPRQHPIPSFSLPGAGRTA